MRVGSDRRIAVWRGPALVAITYVYFLIFAQFGFLGRLAALGIIGDHLKAVMAAMALGGVLFSLVASDRRALHIPARTRLRAALLVCAVAATLAVLPLTLWSGLGVAFLIGAGLGTLTVTLVTHLGSWLAGPDPLFYVALGTGAGYLLCNLPPLFTASPQMQCLAASLLCLAGLIAVGSSDPALLRSQEKDRESTREQAAPSYAFPLVLLSFTALIWLDSAAFYIIQNTAALKAGTWQGSAHLWLNGALHLGAALAAAWMLRRFSLQAVLGAAFAALGTASLLLLNPARAPLASLFYPVGVSLYSVALVAYPALLLHRATLLQRARRAGLIYAVAGWIGSALGIGMAQNLGHIPPAFVLVAGLVILSPMLLKHRRREVALTVSTLALAFAVDRIVSHRTATTTPQTQIERGRQVYIAEGCIHCHSQYVRPGTPDVLLWGPTETLAELRTQRPPLIGNRRQGPDLSQVGGRRSRLWLRAHFEAPREVSRNTFMPSYAYLFQPSTPGATRGDDLIAYLQSLQTPDGPAAAAHRLAQDAWLATVSATDPPTADEGLRLFQNNCTTCHAPDGATRNRWHASFRRLPPIFPAGPYLHVHPSDPPQRLQSQIGRIVKFGLPGTDMPGHEYLPDRQIASLSLWLTDFIAQPTHLQPNPTGERR